MQYDWPTRKQKSLRHRNRFLARVRRRYFRRNQWQRKYVCVRRLWKWIPSFKMKRLLPLGGPAKRKWHEWSIINAFCSVIMGKCSRPLNLVKKNQLCAIALMNRKWTVKVLLKMVAMATGHSQVGFCRVSPITSYSFTKQDLTVN